MNSAQLEFLCRKDIARNIYFLVQRRSSKPSMIFFQNLDKIIQIIRSLLVLIGNPFIKLECCSYNTFGMCLKRNILNGTHRKLCPCTLRGVCWCRGAHKTQNFGMIGPKIPKKWPILIQKCLFWGSFWPPAPLNTHGLHPEPLKLSLVGPRDI